MTAEADSKAAKRQGSTPQAKSGPVVTLGAPSDRDEGPGSLRPIGGSGSRVLNGVLANQAAAALWLPTGLAEDERNRLHLAAAVAMMEFKPADGIEGMMAAQAVGLHSAAMECLRRAMIPEQSGEASDQLRRQGANLSRAFLDVVAALDRKRGKGTKQVVRVERVMVAPGGQVIVGNVQAGGTGKEQHGEGVGHDEGTGGEPHATPAIGTTPARLAHDAAPGAVLPPLRSAHTGRGALPVPSHAERPLPDARRRLDGA